MFDRKNLYPYIDNIRQEQILIFLPLFFVAMFYNNNLKRLYKGVFMEKINFEISPIIYRRKQIDTGIILGKRRYRWMLRRKYSPLYAKDLGDKTYISALTPHKRDFQVYIPASCLTVGQKILIHRHEYKQDAIKQTLRIVKVSRNCGIFGLGDSVTCEVEKEEIIEKKIEIKLQTGAKDKDGSFAGEYVFGGERAATPPKKETPSECPFDFDDLLDEDVKTAYIGSSETETPQEPQEEPFTTDVPTLFVLPGTQAAFELSGKTMTRQSFLQVTCLHTHAHTRPRGQAHAEQYALKLPVMPLNQTIKPHNRIKTEQLPLIVFEGYQYGLFGG